MKRFLFAAPAILLFCWATGAAQDKKVDDPLAADSQWKGKLTQRGKIQGTKEIPPEFDTVLVVTKRTAKEFECELREKAGDSFVTYLCKGKITPADKGAFKVDFESVGVKAANEGFIAVERVPYTGTISGKTLKGTWKYPLSKEDTEVEGDFNLERQ